MKYRIDIFGENINCNFEINILEEFKAKWKDRNLFYIKNDKGEFCFDLSKFYSYKIQNLKRSQKQSSKNGGKE